MNIAQILHKRAVAQPGAPAIIDVHRGRDRTISFGELEAATTICAAQIAAHGIGEGDGVLLLHPVSAELYTFLIALFRIGAIAVVLDPSAGRRHIERCCGIFPLKGVFGSQKAQLLRLFVPALRRISVAFCSGWFPGTTAIASSSDLAPLDAITAVDENAPALVTFTSGSTGLPKAALRSHGFLIAQHHALEASLGLRAGTVDLTTLPVFVLANLASGVTSVLPNADMRSPGLIDPVPVIAQIKRNSVSTTAASPAFIARLVEQCRPAARGIDGLEHVFLGGAPVFPNDLRRAHATFPLAIITAVYGSTEAEPMAEVSFAEITDADFMLMEGGRGLLTGKAVPSISLRIIREQWGSPIGSICAEQFSSLCLPTTEIGEIVVSGAHVLPGYLHGSGDSETKFDVEGVCWHRTGDLGYLDLDARLWLMGRASGKIADERGVLYPFAVECAAQIAPGVKRAALAHCPGKRILVIEAADGCQQAKLMSNLAWAQLDEIRAVRSIPMDRRHNAKVDYSALSRLVADGDRRSG